MNWLSLADEAATLRFGARLARTLPQSGEPLVLYLRGGLGAGKTTLARGILRELGEQGVVRSPTYSLVSEYQPGTGRVLHLDLYRLGSREELLALGLADYLPGSRLWLIEWPERAEGGGLPAADATVYLEPEGSARRVRLESASARGARWAEVVTADSG